MEQITISTYSYASKLQEYIERRMKRPVEVKQTERIAIVVCSFAEFKGDIIIPLAQAMVDIIEKEFAPDYANEVMETRYDLSEIKVMDIVGSPEQSKMLQGPITQEMLEQGGFCLDGWIRFRIADYRQYIMELVDNLVNEYYAYEEYQEFIQLLQEFVINQKPLTDVIHIVPGYAGQIDLYNGSHKKITIMSEGERDDLILGTLLSVAPLNIIIHSLKRIDNIGLMETIQRIYSKKVTFCGDCQLCKRFRFHKRVIQALKDILTPKKQ